MAFPDEGVYYIKCVVNDVEFYANTIGENFLLSGTGEKHQKWRLQYLDYEGENERACTLSEVGGLGAGYLSVFAVENDQRVRRLSRPQLWYLGEQEGDFRIYQCRNSVYFAWKFNAEGDRLRQITLSNNIQWQSWAFELVEED